MKKVPLKKASMIAPLVLALAAVAMPAAARDRGHGHDRHDRHGYYEGRHDRRWRDADRRWDRDDRRA